MIVAPNMGLTRWDGPNDVFDYEELGENFQLLDYHDHTVGKGVQIPTKGLANLAVTNAKIAANAVADSSKLASDAVISTHVPDANITDAKLTSPDNGVWRNIWQVNGWVGAFAASTPQFIVPSMAIAIPVSSTTAAQWVSCFTPITAAERAVAGKTCKARMMVVMRTNNVGGSGVAFTFLMSRVTVSGATAMTLTQAASATVASISNPAASSVVVSYGTEVDFASAFTVDDATYAPIVTFNNPSAANHLCSIEVFIQTRYV